MRRPRNVLFITADQWRGDCLSVIGHPMVRTPNLDALASEGVLFANHFANTVPCSPSRASLHTGLYQHNHRVAVNGTPLDRRHANWALLAQSAGYDAALIGYTDQTPDPRDVGFDDPSLRTYENVLPGLRAVAHVGMDHPGPWAQFLRARGYAVPEDERHVLWLRGDGPEYEHGGPSPKPWSIRSEDNDTSWHVDQSLDFISEHRNNPWVLHLSLLRPHPPWIASDPWNRLYDPEHVPASLCATDVDVEGQQHPWLAYQLSNPLFRAPGNGRKLARYKAVYFGMMSEVDHHLGRLFQHMKQEGVWDDTLIIFTSDHGEQLGDHWLLGKCGYFDQSYRVPMIMRGPYSVEQPRQIIHRFTEHVDVMPTILDFIGVDIPIQCDGHSLLPFMRGSTPRHWRRAAHFEFDFRDVQEGRIEPALNLSLDSCNLTVTRDDRFKFVHFAGLEPLLFDLQRDPGEFKNLARDRDHAEIVTRYTSELLKWRQQSGDRTLTNMIASPQGLFVRPRPI